MRLRMRTMKTIKKKKILLTAVSALKIPSGLGLLVLEGEVHGLRETT
jgi:hypothetical protein